MIFQSFPAFFAVYIPLVILAIFAIIFEEKLIAFEQKIKIQVKKLFKVSKKSKSTWKYFYKGE